jgi:hypothetical protein
MKQETEISGKNGWPIDTSISVNIISHATK